MNKKIKIIDLAINIANEEWNKVPSRIIFEGEDFVFDREEKKYKQVNEDYICLCFPTYKLNDEVEILEDNTEDKGYELLKTIKNENNTEEIENIEELYLEKVHTIPPSIFLEETLLLCEDKINELVKVINSIRKDKSK